MLTLSVANAKPGMMLAMPVCHPAQPGHVLLRPGFRLDTPTLRRLAELRVSRLYIRYPALEEVIRFANPEVLDAHADLTATLAGSLDRLAKDAHAELEFRAYSNAVRSLVSKLIEHPSSRLLVAEVAGSGPDRALAGHSGAVCFLSLLLGLKLEAYLMVERAKVGPMHARNIENLGIGALLHDVGVLRLPSDVVDRHNATGNEEDPAWREHVRLGYEMVRGKVEPTAAVALLHHHQRFDGAGYPLVEPAGADAPGSGSSRALRGGEIHVFARIIAVADLFDRLRHPTTLTKEGRPRNSVPTVRVLRRLLDLSRRRLIDPIVFKGLLAAVPAFAPGSVVTLHSGRQCVVTGFDPLNPCRPTLRELRAPLRALDPDHDELGETFSLVGSAESIAEAEGEPVAADLFEPADAAEFDVRVLTPPRSGGRGLKLVSAA
jgi:HD-GYP domain-containing protein (c-di-GMP phosphodiesterase class II)